MTCSVVSLAEEDRWAGTVGIILLNIEYILLLSCVCLVFDWCCRRLSLLTNQY